MIKITVVIPVYNTKQYLHRCLNSIVSQTLKDIEIICVNDGSTDDSPTILREYAEWDSRITIIDFSRNKGVSSARNAGIAISNGEYLGFVDSDDAVAADFYEKLYAKAHETGACIAKGVRERTSEEGVTAIEPLNNKVRLDRFTFRYQWQTAIYQTALIREHGIYFPIGVSNSEDAAFLTKAISLVDSIEIVDDALYHTFRRVSSLSAGPLGYAKIQGTLKAHEDIIAFINSRPITEEAYDRLFFTWLLMCCNTVASGTAEERPAIATACAEAAIRIYPRCKRREALDAGLANSGYGVYDYIVAGDVAGLANYLLPKTLAQRKAESLRARLKNRQ